MKAKMDNGAIVDLSISGNVTSSQMSNIMISTNQSNISTTVSFTVTGESGTTGSSRITIPKTAILYGTKPLVFIDGQEATSQSYTQDSENFYVWYTTQFSMHQIRIQFSVFLAPETGLFVPWFVIALIVPEIVIIYTVIAVKRLRRKPESA